VRVPTGFKYAAIAQEGEGKRVYDRALAARVVKEHAANFVYTKRFQMEKAAELMDRPPLVVAAYDMEFLGHWWFEASTGSRPSSGSWPPPRGRRNC
jgi:1,4-alpha-glucan branching enzyme